MKPVTKNELREILAEEIGKLEIRFEELEEKMDKKISESENRLIQRFDNQRIVIIEEIRKTNQKVDLLAMFLKYNFDKVPSEEE